MKRIDLEKIKKIKKNIILAKIINTKGSVPRNENVKMAISSFEEYGTIGGGELEFQIIKKSRDLLNNNKKNKNIVDLPLGPALGQCCGGYVKIQLIKYKNGNILIKENDLINEIIENNLNLYIFGAGHVSKALISKIEGVGFNVFVVDSRENFISKIKQSHVVPIFSKDNNIIIKNAPSNAYYLIMTHSHKIDLDICSLILNKNNFSFIGLIGSKTKKNRFSKRLADYGFSKNLIEKIECPIGIENIKGKEPDIIAISIIARLLEFKYFLQNKDKNYIRLVK